VPQPCFLDPTCSDSPPGLGGLGCNAGGVGQNCRYCGFGSYPTCPLAGVPKIYEDCINDKCSEACCPNRDVVDGLAADPWCPNCQGANFTCLTAGLQAALGNADALGATHNNFALPNSGFCAMQAHNSSNRSTTMGPKLLTNALVFSGVGLSQAQFGLGVDTSLSGTNRDGSIACGMCLEVSAPMVQWNCELTEVTDEVASMQRVIVMVMDQCFDGWTSFSDDGMPLGNCPTGHLDFDVYTDDVGGKNMGNVTWRVVDCPVGDLPIQVVFSSGDTPGSSYYFALHLWDLLAPAAKVEVECSDGSFSLLDYTPNGFGYSGACGAVPWPALTLRLTSVYDEQLLSTLSFDPDSLSRPSTDDPIFLPPVSMGMQFTLSKNPASSDANANYKDCVTR